MRGNERTPWACRPASATLSFWLRAKALFIGCQVRVVFLVGLNLALTYLNYRGLHIVGNVAIATAVFTLLPFAVIAGLGERGREGGREGKRQQPLSWREVWDGGSAEPAAAVAPSSRCSTAVPGSSVHAARWAGWLRQAAARQQRGVRCKSSCLPRHAPPCPAAGLPHVNPANWVQVDWAAVDWVPFLNVMFWRVLPSPRRCSLRGLWCLCL